MTCLILQSEFLGLFDSMIQLFSARCCADCLTTPLPSTPLLWHLRRFRRPPGQIAGDEGSYIGAKMR